MQTVIHKPDTAPVLFDSDYRDFIWRLMEKLEQRDIRISDLQREVVAYRAKVDDLARRVR
jgi:hypothetical protein